MNIDMYRHWTPEDAPKLTDKERAQRETELAKAIRLAEKRLANADLRLARIKVKMRNVQPLPLHRRGQNTPTKLHAVTSKKLATAHDMRIALSEQLTTLRAQSE